MKRHVGVLLGLLALALAEPSRAANIGTPVGSAFTYQGRLNQGGSPANGSFDFRFRLVDAATNGFQIGSTLTKSAVAVTLGTFTTTLDFGGSSYFGAALWLEIGVRPANTGDFVILAPLQPLSPAPFAIFSLAGMATNVNCVGCVDSGDIAAGQIGASHLINGGVSLEKISTAGASAGHVLTFNGSATSWQSAGGGLSLPFSGSTSAASAAMTIQHNTTGAGVVAKSVSGPGVVAKHGTSDTFDVGAEPVGVGGQSDAGFGVFGLTEAGTSAGVQGSDLSTEGGAGVRGLSLNGTGVVGVSPILAGYFENSSSSHKAYLAEDDNAAMFIGNVAVAGNLSKSGGSFRIDHPLDPANRILSHSFVESPDMMNVYNGNVTLDGSGSAVVELPSYFEALNRDFRYQLTAIGAPSPNLHVAAGVLASRFVIAGGTPGAEVSWQVTGIRKDAWAAAHPILVEEEKPEEERGTYETPAEHGQPDTRHVRHVRDRLRKQKTAVR
jgi:hypothetical protein